MRLTFTLDPTVASEALVLQAIEMRAPMRRQQFLRGLVFMGLDAIAANHGFRNNYRPSGQAGAPVRMTLHLHLEHGEDADLHVRLLAGIASPRQSEWIRHVVIVGYQACIGRASMPMPGVAVDIVLGDTTDPASGSTLVAPPLPGQRKSSHPQTTKVAPAPVPEPVRVEPPDDGLEGEMAPFDAAALRGLFQ